MKLGCEEFMRLYRSKQAQGAILLDIRNDDEVAQGMLANAKHIPLPELGSRSGELPQDADIFIYCRSGARAQRAIELLTKQGFHSVVIAINGGYENLCKL